GPGRLDGKDRSAARRLPGGALQARANQGRAVGAGPLPAGDADGAQAAADGPRRRSPGAPATDRAGPLADDLLPRPAPRLADPQSQRPPAGAALSPGRGPAGREDPRGPHAVAAPGSPPASGPRGRSEIDGRADHRFA